MRNLIMKHLEMDNINKSMNENSIKNNWNILNESRRRLILYKRIKRRLNGKDNIELNERIKREKICHINYLKKIKEFFFLLYQKICCQWS